jgi:hypothetical protein
MIVVIGCNYLLQNGGECPNHQYQMAALVVKSSLSHRSLQLAPRFEIRRDPSSSITKSERAIFARLSVKRETKHPVQCHMHDESLAWKLSWDCSRADIMSRKLRAPMAYTVLRSGCTSCFHLRLALTFTLNIEKTTCSSSTLAIVATRRRVFKSNKQL